MYSFAQRHLIDPNIRAFNPRTREGQANWLFAFLSVALVLLFIVALTWWEYGHLRHLGDTAPFLDGLTTAMSIGAFWMQARKYIENWWIWILADCIYIPLYFSKALPLTGVLYILFMATCFYGIYDWQRKLPGNSILARLTARRPTYSDSLYHGVVVGD
jgi:nicotinamide mononucleotide transporter PnuC